MNMSMNRFWSQVPVITRVYDHTFYFKAYNSVCIASARQVQTGIMFKSFMYLSFIEHSVKLREKIERGWQITHPSSHKTASDIYFILFSINREPVSLIFSGRKILLICRSFLNGQRPVLFFPCELRPLTFSTNSIF